MTSINFKRGDDFRMDITVTDPQNGDAIVDITGWVILSQVRFFGDLTADLSVTIIDAVAGSYRVSATPAQTELWEVGTHQCDIQITEPANGRQSSETFDIIVVEDVTLNVA